MANFNGTVGNDVIIGTMMQDAINAGDGNDTILAGEGDNSVNAGNGDDSVTAGAGHDALNLGEGNNWLVAGDGNNLITAGRGNDTVTAGQGNDVISVGEGNNLVSAGNGNNTVATGSGNDSVTTGSGDDVISVGFGDNLVDAGAGNNVVTAGSGNDSVTTGSGDDVIAVGFGDNLVDAGAGNNVVTAASGDDTVTAGAGNDVIAVGFGDNLVNAGSGNNVVTAASGNDTVTAGGGNDVIAVGFGDNLVNAGGGNNVVATASGDDTVTTGAGNDVISAGEGDNVIDAGAGYDVVSTGSGSDLFIHRLAGNTLSHGLRDIYQGGFGRDTLRLELTSAEWARADVQSDVAAFLAHLAHPVNQTLNPLGLSTQFNFSVTSLAVFNIENLQISVNGVLLDPRDEAVTAVLDQVNATEDSASVSVDLLANDAVPDRAVSVQLLSNSTLGTLALASDLAGAAQSATLTFTPNAALQSLAAGQSVTETISYRVTDADGETSTASITITVVGQNDGATISGLSTGAVAEDAGALVAGNLAVSDVDNGEAIFQAASGLNGTYGSFTFNAISGDWAYDLNDAAANVQSLRAGEVVEDRITVTSLDGTASQEIVVTITGTNDTPVVAAPVLAAASEGVAAQTIDLLAGASDVDTGETATLSVANVTGLVAGLTLVGNSIVLDAADASFDDLALGQTRDVTITYDVVDAQGASVAQTATITITGTNDAPVVAAAVTAGANEDDAALTIDLLAGASDVDAGETATLSVANVTGLVAGLTLVGNSIVLDAADASFDDLALGQTRDVTITYDVVDAQGASVAQTATITITGTNDGPVVAAPVLAAASEGDAALTIDLLAGASDVDTGETATLSVANVTGLVAGLTLNGNSIVVDPSDAAFNDLGAGQTRDLIVTYDVVDAQGATVAQTATITITGTNSAPVVSAPVLAAANEGGAVQTINLLAGASDADLGETATLSVANVVGLVDGLTLSGNSIVLDPANATFDDLALGQTRDVTVTYDVVDTQGASVAQSLTITITGTADAPVVTAQTFAAVEDTVITGQIVASDVDAGETAGLTYALANPAAAPVGLTFNADGSFSFDASSYDSIAQGTTRTVTFDVTATDTLGFRSAAQTISLEIAGTNDAPVAVNVSLSGGQTVNAGFDQGFTGWTVINGPQTGPNGETARTGTYTQSVFVQPGNAGTIPGDNAVASLAFSATLTTFRDGPNIGTLFGPSLISNPFTGITGDTVSFVYRAFASNDDASITAVLVNTQTGAITPVFFANTRAFTSGAVETVNVPITDSGVYQIRFTVGSFDATDGGVLGARLVIGTAGIVRSGVGEDSQRVFDAITFTGSTTDVDQGAIIALDSVDALSQNGALVSINSAGQVVYDTSTLDFLTAGETLNDSFTYTITDEFGATSSATATITVEGVNDAPVVAGPVTAAASEGDGVQTISLLSGASDADRGETATLRVANVAGLVSGLVLSGNNVVLDPSSEAFNGLAEGETRAITLTYNVIDAQGASVAQSAVITITGTNDAPVVSGTPLLLNVVDEGRPSQTFSLLAGASDVDTGETATLTVANVAGLVDGLTLSGNTLTIDPSSSAFDYLAQGQSEALFVTYDVVDAQGASVRQDAYVVITGTNDAPVVSAVLAATATEGGALQSIDLLAGASDADRGQTATLTVANVSGLVPGLTLSGNSLVIDPSDGAFDDLAAGQTRDLTVSYNVVDADGGAVAQTATITIVGTNDAPVVLNSLVGAFAEGTGAGSLFLLPLASDVDAGETATLNVANVTGLVGGLTQSGNNLVVDTNNAAFNALPLGQIATINVSYDVVDAQGASVAQTALIQIIGTNDAASITGLANGFTVEDTPSNAFASGTLQVTDPDAGQSSLVAQSNVLGTAGLGTFNVFANGAWTYQINNASPAVQALVNGQTVTDTLTVVSADGSASQVIQVGVDGRDEPVVLIGNNTAETLTVPSSNRESARIIGNQGRDTIVGGSGADVIFGDGVNDVQSPVVAAGPLTARAASYYVGSNVLVNGLGGAEGFGEGNLGRGDDYFFGPIDITSVFGTSGLNFFGTNYTSLYVGSNGYVTFGGGASSYTTTTISAGGFATIASFFSDVDTRFGPVTPSAGGTSTGANLISYDIDAVNGVFTMTLNDAGQYSFGSVPNATQLMLVDRDNGNFDIILRYETVDWNYGDRARAGYTSGGATPVVFEIPGSGTGASLNWDATAGNTGRTGIYVLEVRDGAVTTNLIDRITGGAGNDTITGGDGADMFVFNSTADGVDTITDFASGVDDIGILVAGFGGGLVAGGTASVQNVSDLSGAANAQFIFDTDATGGNLYWDADGGASDNAVLLARLNGVSSLTSGDFFLF